MRGVKEAKDLLKRNPPPVAWTCRTLIRLKWIVLFQQTHTEQAPSRPWICIAKRVVHLIPKEASQDHQSIQSIQNTGLQCRRPHLPLLFRRWRNIHEVLAGSFPQKERMAIRLAACRHNKVIIMSKAQENGVIYRHWWLESLNDALNAMPCNFCLYMFPCPLGYFFFYSVISLKRDLVSGLLQYLNIIVLRGSCSFMILFLFYWFLPTHWEMLRRIYRWVVKLVGCG